MLIRSQGFISLPHTAATTLKPDVCLQIGNKDMLNCYYAHAEEGEHAQMVRL